MDNARKSGINTFFFFSTSWKVEYAAIIKNHSKEFNHLKKIVHVHKYHLWLIFNMK